MRIPKLPFLSPAPVVLAAGVLSTAVLALSTSGTLSAFTAQINGTDNSVVSRTLVMKQTGPRGDGTAATATCTSSATSAAACTQVNAFGGGVVVPGSSSEYDVKVESVGSAYPRTFTLTAGGCAHDSVDADAGSGNLCSSLQVRITNGAGGGGSQIYDGPASGLDSSASFTNFPAPPVAGAASATFHFTVSLPAGATKDVQGQKATVPLTWAYTL